ncbi:hypothetical protein JW711_01865 [Candidatus Woesearchaeota archaeon]|nr:hypothetical protein [Candidatus Woesearchaeota archaeon]
MKIGRHNKMLLFEQEFLTLLLIVILGLVSYYFNDTVEYYFFTLGLGFILYFWMTHEEKVHITGKKHEYFEHTSSFVMIAQTAVAAQLVGILKHWSYVAIISSVISIVMYSLTLSRIVLFKAVFQSELHPTAPAPVPAKKKSKR